MHAHRRHPPQERRRRLGVRHPGLRRPGAEPDHLPLLPAHRQPGPLGNPARFFDKERATRLRDHGWGQIRIARALGVGMGRVHRWVKEEYRPPE